MKEIFEKLTLVVTIPYLIGILITQIYISQFGIFEISLVESIYVFNGIVLLLTITPGFLIIVFSDFAYGKNNNTKIIVLSSISVFILFSLPLYWIISYEFFNRLILFDCYLYPNWYFFANLVWCNSLLIGLYFFVRFFRDKIQFLRNRIVLLLFFAVFIGVYIFFYSKTIYPALSSKIGGGHPREAQIFLSKESAKIDALILLETSNSFYYADLNLEITENCNYKGLSNNQKVLCENIIEYVNKSKIDKVIFLNKKNNSSIKRYIKDGKHIGF